MTTRCGRETTLVDTVGIPSRQVRPRVAKRRRTVLASGVILRDTTYGLAPFLLLLWAQTEHHRGVTHALVRVCVCSTETKFHNRILHNMRGVVHGHILVTGHSASGIAQLVHAVRTYDQCCGGGRGLRYDSRSLWSVTPLPCLCFLPWLVRAMDAAGMELCAPWCVCCSKTLAFWTLSPLVSSPTCLSSR